MSSPLVSIGLPVRNGEKFLRQVIDSILAQSYEDFELLICDNASTDRTTEICREYERLDPRVSHYRNSCDIGPAANFNRCVELSAGRYFKWAAADDLIAPDYLRACLEVLEKDPTVVLCQSRTRVIDEQDRPVFDDQYLLPTDSPKAAVRFASLMQVNHKRHGAFEIFGLIRSSDLRATGLFGCYARADSVLLARLSLRGRFVMVPQFLFFNRDHGNRSIRTVPSGLQDVWPSILKILGTGPLPPLEWWDSSMRGRINFPEWRLLWEYARSLRSVPAKRSQRLTCWVRLATGFAGYVPKLIRDLLLAMAQWIFSRRTPPPARLAHNG